MSYVNILIMLLSFYYIHKITYAFVLNENKNSENNLIINKIDGFTFGAEIIGIDLENINHDLFETIHKNLLESKVLIIRNQTNLSVEGLRQFTKNFGPLHIHLESSSHLPGYTDVNVVSNLKNEFGDYIGLHGPHVENYHSDLSWAPLPTKVTVLLSVIRSDHCGDTIFADTNAAYDSLNTETKQLLTGLKASYSYLKHRNLSNITQDGLSISESEKALNVVIHPVITTHPITRRKNIYANPSHTIAIVDMDIKQSNEILNKLYTHTSEPTFAYVHKWQDFDVVIWDNRG